MTGPRVEVGEPPERTVTLSVRRAGGPAVARRPGPSPTRRYGRPRAGSGAGLRLAVGVSLLVVVAFALGLYVCVAWIVAPLEREAARRDAIALARRSAAAEPPPRPPLRSFRTTHAVALGAGSAVEGIPRAVDVAAPGEHLAVSGHARGLELRDLPSLAASRPPLSGGALGSRPVAGIAFRRDGAVVAAAFGGRQALVAAWDVATGRLLGREVFPRPVEAVRFRGDGLLQVVSGAFVYLWDVAAGRLVGRFPIAGEEGPAARSVTTPDGRFLARQDGPLVEVWDLERRVRAARVALADGTRLLALRGDGAYVAAAQGDDVVLFRISPLSRVRRLRGHASPPGAAALSPDGLMLASAALNEVVLWDLATGQVASRARFRGRQSFEAVAFAGDSRTVAAVAPTQVRLWGVW